MWNYFEPVRVIFSAGAKGVLGDELASMGVCRGLLVTSPSFSRRGTVAELCEAAGGRIAAVFDHVSPNPEVEQCDACVALLRENDCDFVVALGGGSVMDCAKAASTIVFGTQSATYYLGTGNPLPERHMPVIALPTTAGTGSEVTSVAVLSDHARGLKAPMSSASMYPALAIVDPELTYSAPAKLTAASGLDALCHAIEAYWNRNHIPVCDALAVRAAKMVLDNLENACRGDRTARDAMAEASLTAGLAFNLPKTTSAHACSYPLTNILGIDHGEACALTITWFMRFNASHGDGRTAALARELGYGSAYALADAVDALRRACGIRMDLRDLALDDAVIAQLAAASRHPNLLNNPVDVSDADLLSLYFGLCK